MPLELRINPERPRIFFGAAIQGAFDRAERAHIHAAILDCILAEGFDPVFDHTRAKSRDQNSELLTKLLGPLPTEDLERRKFVRNKMIEGVEGEIAGAIFEVSTPSLGTGIEIAHAYLRPRMGLPEIPVLLLYQLNYWANNLSTMIQGIDPKDFPNIQLREYTDLLEAGTFTQQFLLSLPEKPHRLA